MSQPAYGDIRFDLADGVAVRAVVVTGAGDAFCVGADMSAGAETFAEPDSDFSATPVLPAAWDVRKPVIAAMNGHAVGLGLTLALQCDLRIAADEAKYAYLERRAPRWSLSVARDWPDWPSSDDGTNG